MKILTKQKQRELEKLIFANTIIANDLGHKGFTCDRVDHYATNVINILDIIGGEKAVSRLMDKFERYLDEGSQIKKGGEDER